MNPIEAKRNLLAYRPGTDDADDPQIAEALAESRRDSGLHEWAVQQAAFQQGMRRVLREIPVPPDLRERILVRNKVLAPRWWQRTSIMAAAAVIALLLGLGWLLLQPAAGRSFEIFRDRMVRAVLRQYTMDIVTNDMAVIRRFLHTRNAPSNYVLPPGLSKLPVLGAGVLSWRQSRATMVCLDSTNQGTLFLFVVDTNLIAGAPGPIQEFSQVSKLATVSWSEGGLTYVLAGTGSRETLQQYWK